jgi:hypothetical protein
MKDFLKMGHCIMEDVSQIETRFSLPVHVETSSIGLQKLNTQVICQTQIFAHPARLAEMVADRPTSPMQSRSHCDIQQTLVHASSDRTITESLQPSIPESQ